MASRRLFLTGSAAVAEGNLDLRRASAPGVLLRKSQPVALRRFSIAAP